ncbi:DUF418 domain-containing protein [Sphingomonas sp. NBWT7]|uniref:DUF418 domain-containing protein n=1 Tax=Sphingomonas sp. NBWT7 TaxID=2596913 RepID=UPI001626C770|nr:DUF418 domain-containing protein [Sphingomonas sp. NBWT7]QNE31474.1 DUF418 domain-containing protein [Sphingomonas sp. NBWT7]
MTAAGSTRIVALDAVRGMAVLGILLLNIVDFAMPRYAYVDPTFYGGATGADWWAWALTFVVADGKMRGLFSMLFGASMLLVAERAQATGESPFRVHMARMAVLFVIGMVHAYLIWSGDILVLYALCGVLAFAFREARLSTLLAIAAILMLGEVATAIVDHHAARAFEARATQSGASATLQADWAQYMAGIADLRASIPAELATYRGGWAQVLPARAAATWQAQREMIPGTLADTLAMMLLGMALFRSGFFAFRWRPPFYQLMLAIGYGAALPLTALLAWWIDRRGFDPITLALAEPLQLALLRPWVALAHASVIILAVERGVAARLIARLAATGRMAFTNYLATSIICAWIFCGYGLGWFGMLTRWQLYPVVLAIWALLLGWSPWWLARFRYGPFEWLWRSASRMIRQRLRR